MNRFNMKLAAALAIAISGAANADVVYSTGTPDGFFTPFVSTSPAGLKYGDSGWFGTGSSPAVALTEITLGLSTFSNTPVPAGTADIVFTLNDGDPSGLVFGPGTTLYSTTIPNVTLPAADGGLASNFELTIPLPSVMTSGGFNNIGWSVGVANFNYAGQFGFQDKGNFNNIGFMTANASEYNPSTGWSLFAFGPSFPSDSPNFVARISTPEPASLTALAAVSLVARRRR